MADKFKISAHHDADGISATVLYMKSVGLELEDVEVDFPDEFGLAHPDTDMIVDMVPREPEYSGECIDHHDQHPYEKDREYTLIYDEYPSAVTVYNRFMIPDEESWKVAIGAVGDVQPEEIPGEIFLINPFLRDSYSSLWKDYDTWSLKSNVLPAYKLISSPVNAMARVGNEQMALEKVYNAEKPEDLIYDSDAVECKQNVRKEFKRIVKGVGKVGQKRKGSRKMYEWNDIIYVPFRSDYRISGYIGAQVHDDMDKTVLSLNLERGKGSVRGDLTNMVAEALKQHDFHVGGHGGACGVTIDSSRDDELLEVLRSL